MRVFVLAAKEFGGQARHSVTNHYKAWELETTVTSFGDIIRIEISKNICRQENNQNVKDLSFW